MLEFTGLRTEIRAKVQFVEPVPNGDPNMTNLVPTLEVFDHETGGTSFVLAQVSEKGDKSTVDNPVD
ncbi:MAG: hypothetical protein DMF76_12810 [Acidobacteria bacterium]|nr:MAG: hypothetical protein DMF76_12810 [Acidobacteriota bacterium]